MEGTISHLFLRCTYFTSMCHLIRDWLGFSSVELASLAYHFLQFSVIGGFQRSIRPFMHLIWLPCVWTIWKEMNNRIFNNKEVHVP